MAATTPCANRQPQTMDGRNNVNASMQLDLFRRNILLDNMTLVNKKCTILELLYFEVYKLRRVS